MKNLWKALFLAACALVPSQAQAVNSISAVTYKTNVTLHTASIKAIVSGDDDSSAVLRTEATTPAEYRTRGTAAFDTMLTMTRSKHLGKFRIHDAMLLWLKPGTKYYWRVVFTDEDGGSGTSAIDSVTTRTIPELPTTGPIFYVSQADGSDAFDGLAPTAQGGGVGPKLTIAAAKTALAATTNGGPGGGIFLLSGNYREKVTLDAGTDTPNTYRFLARYSNEDTVSIESDLPQIRTSLTFELINSGGADSTYRAILPRSTIKDSVSSLMLNWDEYIQRKTSVSEILTNATGETSGWFIGNDTLYIRRDWTTMPLASTPQGEVLHLGYQLTQNALLVIAKRNWIIKGITFRWNGSLSSGAADGHAIQLGNTAVNGSGAVIQDCTFYGVAGHSVYLPLWGGGGRADSAIVTGCQVSGRGIGRMTYQASKFRVEENALLIKNAGLASITYNNTITDIANGIQVAPSGSSGADTTWGSCGEVSYNNISWVADDGLELDWANALPMAVFKNTVTQAIHGVSMCPTVFGPLYIFNNVLYRFRDGAFKVGASNSAGRVFLYHNTIAHKENLAAKIVVAINHVGGVAQNMTLQNNVFVAGGVGGNWAVISMNAETATSNRFDWNAYDSSAVFSMIKYNGTNFYMQVQPGAAFRGAWQNVQAQDLNSWKGGFAFQDSSTSRYGLTPTSVAALNRGVRIAGVNTDVYGNRYTNAPDMGAFELGWPANKRSFIDRLRGVFK